MTLTDEQRGEAFLRDGASLKADAPPWLDAIVDGRIIAAIVEPLVPIAAHPAFTEREEVSPGRWAVARALTTDADISDFVAAVERAARGGRAGIAISAGTLGARGPLGDAPHDALRLCADLAGRAGVLIDPWVHRVVGGPAETLGGGRLRLSRPVTSRLRWVGIAAIVALAGAIVLGINLRQPPVPPAGYIYVFGQRAAERSAAPPSALLRRNDGVQVTIEGDPGQHASLILLDSDGRLSLPDSAAINVALTAERPRISSTFTFDGRPGQERFMAVFSPAPLVDLPAIVDALNARKTTDLAAVRAHVPSAYLVAADPVEHAP
ncbi:MAG: hypothetical protein ACI9U2_001662 [Bradymonadia bacterium]|jgi:hypothetical protein